MIGECFQEMGTNAAQAIAPVRAYAEPADTGGNFRRPAIKALRAMQGTAQPLIASD